MGMNVGVTVKKQLEEYMSEGCNPKGTREQIEQRFEMFLRTKFPDDSFSPFVRILEDAYDFDVRLAYDWNGYDATPMIVAILEYVCGLFSQTYGIDIRVSKSV